MVLRYLEGVNTRITGRWRRGLHRERRLVGSRSWGMEEWHGLTSRWLRTEVDERWNSLKRRQDRRTPHLVAGVGVDGARTFHRFGQAAADRAEGEGGDIALWSYREICGFGGKLDATIEAQAGFAQEFGAEAHVFGAIDAPEPELFFVALQEIDGFLELFHGFIEIGGQEKDAEEPSVARIAYADAHAVLAALVAFDRTPIIIAASTA